MDRRGCGGGHRRHPAVLFETFYREQNGLAMDDEMKTYIDGLIKRIFGEEHA